ncbi:hypothetical protein Leryth_008569 [Lithospermum erythrorhizon]|nr:hypothetical protein Leryth_008569 [Lithospermum erythrorhizon]
MHCEACAQEIRKRILRMKGVESVETDLLNSQVTVKGIFDQPKLVQSIRTRTGKQAVVVKVEPLKKEETPKENAEDKKEEGAGAGAEAEAQGETPPPLMELKKNEFHYYHPQNFQQYYPPRHVPYYNPQIFIDENPNACSVM